MTIYALFILIAGLYMFIIGISNALFLRIKKAAEVKTDGPMVSVLIPARNEEKNLEALLDSLEKQDYKNYEVLIVDDNSTDRTWEIIEKYTSRNPNFHGYKGKPKTDKTVNGKTYALSQIESEAKGEILLATDADTIHETNSISYAVALLEEKKLDMLSGFPEERCPTFLGRACINAMNFAVVAYIPLPIVYRHPAEFFTVANGQFICMRKKALHDIGGYISIDKKLTDDVTLAKRFVKNRKKYSLVRASNVVHCNMYYSTKEAFWGITRSIGGIFPATPLVFLPVLVVIAILLSIAFSPAIALALGLAGYTTAAWHLALGATLFTIAWYVTSREQKFPRLNSLLWPVTLVVICIMYLTSFFTRMNGKSFTWKDREV
jgi:Glycosyltransferases, probably involved in cell wall biogenesis